MAELLRARKGLTRRLLYIRGGHIYAQKKKAFGSFTEAEQSYVKTGIDRFIVGDESRGGYGKRFKRYLIKGGILPRFTK